MATTHGPIPILRLGANLLASIQIELSDSVIDAFQQDVLTAIEHGGARGLIIDITALDTVDSYVARMLATTAKMAGLMGTKAVVVGMRPTVAATLVRMGYYLEGTETALSLEEGLLLLEEAARKRVRGNGTKPHSTSL